jgi:hypothetical protein
VARPLCPGCFSSSVVSVPHGADPYSSDRREKVDGFGALWDAFDDWKCLVCGERWPNIESVVSRNVRHRSTIERPGPRSIVKPPGLPARRAFPSQETGNTGRASFDEMR